MARMETPASQQRNVEIVGGYTSQIIALLAVKHTATVVHLTVQPFVKVESAKTQRATQALRLLTKKPTMAMIQTKFM